MTKRRVTLSLDEDLVEALESVGGRSLSAVANAALRQAVTAEANRAALLHWLDELDEQHGPPTPADLALADDLLDTAEGKRGDGESAA